MRFVGIDLAWKCDPVPLSTAVCIIDGDDFEIELVTDIEEMLSFVTGEGDCFIGIDASLKVPNQTGMRSAEKLVRGMGIHILPTSRNYLNNKFGGSRGERLVDRLAEYGFRMAKPDDRSGRLIYEVFPYAAVRRFTGRSPAYKRGRLSERKQECVQLLRMIQTLHPELHNLDRFADEIGCSNSSGIKAAGDKIDALLCAISVYRHAIYRGHATQMIGDEENGFILLCR